MEMTPLSAELAGLIARLDERQREAMHFARQRSQAISRQLEKWTSDPDWRPPCAICRLGKIPSDDGSLAIDCPALAGTCIEGQRRERIRLQRHHEFMTVCGFGPRYHLPDPERIRERAAVEKYCAAMPENLKRGESLVILGPRGVGKTMILSYIAARAHAADRYLTIKYGTIRAIIDGLAAPGAEDRSGVRWGHPWSSAGLLLVDELGIEDDASWKFGTFHELMETRHAHVLPTVLCGNLSVREWQSEPRYDRIRDRLREQNARLIVIGGDSQRGAER